jgi:hypothetical protein
LFAEFVRQSFHIDLDGLVAEPELYVRSTSDKTHEGADSQIEEVSKETALLLGGAELEPADVIEGLEYDENVGEWAKAIALWMQRRGGDRVEFGELLDGVGLSVVKAWLAILLDEGLTINRLEDSDFYESAGILVGLKREESAIAC